MPFKPDRRGYYIGEKVQSQVHGLDGQIIGNETFTIEQSPGSGFAGQVYKALPESGILFEAGRETVDASVAVKVLRPKSRFKEAFREFLFRLCFQTSFAPRLREEALRSGLIWQKLLRIAAGIEIGTVSAITKPYGYYWDDEIKSYSEIHEWIDARSPRYEADNQILIRRFQRNGNPTNSEMRRKKHFMSEMVNLCNQIGAFGIARQYEWFTFVAQANVLSRRNPTEGQSEFVVIDTRPGLAIPFFLPLSPTHLRIILHGLKSGVFIHFDEVDFRRLDKYLANHTAAFASVDGLIQKLREDDECYRNSLPNLWHTRTRIVRDAAFRCNVQTAIISDWKKLDLISKKKAGQLETGFSRCIPYLMLDNLPFVGTQLLRFAGNEHYRHYLKKVASDSIYLAEAIEVHRAYDLIEWVDSGRVSMKRADMLSNSILNYAEDKVVFSWLPRGLHRFSTDKEIRTKLIRDVFIDPMRLFTNNEFRKEWLGGIIEQQCERGIVTTNEAAKLKEQANDSWMRGFVQDLGFTIGLGVAAIPIYPALLAYGISTGNYLPLLLASGPISPSGIIREAYT